MPRVFDVASAGSGPASGKKLAAKARPGARPARALEEVALLVMIGSGFLALAGSGELDRPTLVALPAALLLRAAMVAGWFRWTIPSALVTVCAALYIPFFFADYFWMARDFFGATVHLLCFLAVVKLLTARTSRDFVFLKLIAGMELIAAALLSSDMGFLLYLAVFLLSGIAALMSGEMHRSMETSRGFADGLTAETAATDGEIMAGAGKLNRRLVLMSSGLFVGLMVITVGLFFVLPRTARAAFLRFGLDRPSILPTEVTLGNTGVIELSSEALMHVRSYDGSPLEGLRWRGGTLASFDGKRWTNQSIEEARVQVPHNELQLHNAGRRQGSSLGYWVELGEAAPNTLFFAGTPESIRIDAPALYVSPAGTMRVPRFGVLRYGAYSNPYLSDPRPLTSEERSQYLQLPGLDARVGELARDWTKRNGPDGTSAMAMARAIEDRFHREFRYSLKQPSRPVLDPLATFLFERRQGHCEYFASGMAVMLRTLGIPSRVVTGFLGGMFNSITGWQVLRGSDAHTWVEAWIPGRGWMTFDPTPSETESSTPVLFERASMLFDAADQFWGDWVVTYDADHQRALVEQIQDTQRTWHFGGWWPNVARLFGEPMGWFLAALGAGGAYLILQFGPVLVVLWQRRQRLTRALRGDARASDATLLYERMLRALERRGWRRAPSVTPQEFACNLPASEVGVLVRDLTDAYNQVRFGGRPEAAPRMASLLVRIEALLA